MYKSYHEVLHSEGGRYRLMQYHERRIPGGHKAPRGGYLPVVFLPGSAGDYDQVASLAAESARSFRKRHWRWRLDLDWYTADFRGEISALDARIIEDQTAFVLHAVTWLHSRHHDRSIVLVGHSYGGIVARNVISRLKLLGREGHVRLLMAFASPLGSPVLMLQPSVAALYGRLHSIQTEVPIVSFSGGRDDFQITHSLKHLPRDVPFPAIHVETVDVVGAWTPVSHRRLLVCNAFVKRVTWMLLDFVNSQETDSFERTSTQDWLVLSNAHLTGTRHVHFDQGMTRRNCRNNNGALEFTSGRNETQPGRRLEIITESNLQDAKQMCIEWDLLSEEMEKMQSVWMVFGSLAPCTGFRIWAIDSGTPHSLTLGPDVSEDITADAVVAPYATEAARPKPVPRNMSWEVIKGQDYLATATWYLHLKHSTLKFLDALHLCIQRPPEGHGFFLVAHLSDQAQPQVVQLTPWNLIHARVVSGFFPPSSVRSTFQIHVRVEISGVPLWLQELGVHVSWSKATRSNAECWNPIQVTPALGANASFQSSVEYLIHPCCIHLVSLKIDYLARLYDLTWSASGQIVSLSAIFVILSPAACIAQKLKAPFNHRSSTCTLQQHLWPSLLFLAPLSAFLKSVGGQAALREARLWVPDEPLDWIYQLGHRLFVVLLSMGFLEAQLWLFARLWMIPSTSLKICFLSRMHSVQQFWYRDAFTVVLTWLFVSIVVHPFLIGIASIELHLLTLAQGGSRLSRSRHDQIMKYMAVHCSGLLFQLPTFLAQQSLSHAHRSLDLSELLFSLSLLFTHFPLFHLKWQIFDRSGHYLCLLLVLMGYSPGSLFLIILTLMGL